VAVTVAVKAVLVVVKIEAGLAAIVVLLANCGVTLVQFLTRLVTLMLPRPVASLYPGAWGKSFSQLVVELERSPYVVPSGRVKSV
jgi:hypothetical protein